MKTISEIFKNRPELLEQDEVKELVEQFRIQFNANKMKHHRYWDKVTELTMNSDLFVIKGIPCKDVVERIHNISFETDYISAQGNWC